MSALPYALRAGFSGEFESEVSLPVRVRFRVDAEGEVEVTHVALTAAVSAENAAHFVWQHLPLRERDALVAEAENEARTARE